MVRARLFVDYPMNDPLILEAALEGLLAQKQRIEDQIGQVRAMLGKTSARNVRAAAVGRTAAPTLRKRVMSAAARKRIAEAQRRRWAEFRKKTAQKEAKE